MNKLEQAARQALHLMKQLGIDHVGLREALYEQAECKECGAKQAQIDRLMLEYCPDEMTPEQMQEWGNNQRPVEQADQEPVGYTAQSVIDWLSSDERTDSAYSNIDLHKKPFGNNSAPLYTSPVRTKDLTDDEICQMWNDWHDVVGAGEFALIARAVIAAYREKNK